MLSEPASMGIAASSATGVAAVARSLIRHRTECRRLELVKHLADRHGVDAMSTLIEIIPPEPTADTRSAHLRRRSLTK